MSNGHGDNTKLHSHHSGHSHHAKHTYHAIHKLLTSKGHPHTKKENETESRHHMINGAKKSMFHHYHKTNIVMDDYASRQRSHKVEHKVEPVNHHLKK